MAFPGQSLAPPKDGNLACGGSFNSSFSSLGERRFNPHALSFTSRSVVGTLDAENPFGPPSASFNVPASFVLPPPDQAMPELYQTLPVVTPSAPSSPTTFKATQGDALLNTATGPAVSSSGPAPLGTATGPAVAMGTATGPAGLPSTMVSMSVSPTASSAQLLPLQSMRIPGTISLPPAPGVTGDPGLVTFNSVPGLMVVPPTAPTFSNMQNLPQTPPALLPSVSAMPAPASASSQYAVGSKVEYLSDKSGSWVSAIVQGYNGLTGEYALDVDPRAHPDKVRPLKVIVPVPTPPGSGIVTAAAMPPALSPVPAPPPPPVPLVPNITVTQVAPTPTPVPLVPNATVTQVAPAPPPASLVPNATITQVAPPPPPSSLLPNATITQVAPPPPPVALVPNVTVTPITYDATPPVTVSTAPAQQLVTLVSTMPATGMTTATAVNPFGSSGTLNPFATAPRVLDPTQSVSSYVPAPPAMEPITQSAPPVTRGDDTDVRLLARSRVSSMMSEPVISSMEPSAFPLGTSTSPAGPPVEPIVAPLQATASVFTEPPSASAYAAQGDRYLAPPEDVWIPLGQPVVRVEPNWRDGQWWYTTAVDFKGLERLPVGSKQESLLIADEALLELEERGEIPPLPAPNSWSETDTCPIT